MSSKCYGSCQSGHFSDAIASSLQAIRGLAIDAQHARLMRKRYGRGPLDARTRNYVVLRDWYACRICGLPIAPDRHVIDHVLPRSLGGTNDPENLRLAHDYCNNIRGPHGGRLRADDEVRAAHLLAIRRRWYGAMDGIPESTYRAVIAQCGAVR